MGPNAVYARNSLVTVLVHWNFAAVFTLILTITTQSFYLFWPWPRSVILLSNSVFQVPPKSFHRLCVQPICYIRLLRSICTGFLNDSANILKLHHNNHHRSAPPAFSLTDSVIETYPAASPAEKRCKHWSRYTCYVQLLCLRYCPGVRSHCQRRARSFRFRLLEDMLRQVVLFCRHFVMLLYNFLQICCVVLIGLAHFIGFEIILHQLGYRIGNLKSHAKQSSSKVKPKTLFLTDHCLLEQTTVHLHCPSKWLFTVSIQCVFLMCLSTVPAYHACLLSLHSVPVKWVYPRVSCVLLPSVFLFKFTISVRCVCPVSLFSESV